MFPSGVVLPGFRARCHFHLCESKTLFTDYQCSLTKAFDVSPDVKTFVKLRQGERQKFFRGMDFLLHGITKNCKRI